MAEEPTPEEKAQEAAKKAFEAACPAPGSPLMAARVGDNHICPMVDGVKPHVGGPVLPTGVPTVLIAGMPAATVGTMCTCASGPDTIIKGSMTVLIGGKQAARMMDQTTHGGMIVQGCPTVTIGG